MTKLEKVGAWLVSGVFGLAFLQIWASGLLIFLSFLVVTLPLVLLAYIMPTVALYITLPVICYLIARLLGGGPRCAIFISTPPLIAALAAGVFVAKEANDAQRQRVAEIRSNDSGMPVQIPDGSVVGIVSATAPDEPRCWDWCQRLLFSGVADTFIHLPPEAVTETGVDLSGLVQYEIGPIEEGCNTSSIFGAYADEDEHSGNVPPPRLFEKLSDFYDDGRCFRHRPAALQPAYLLINEYGGSKPEAQPFDPSLIPEHRWHREAVLVHDGRRFRRAFQRTEVRWSYFAVPLLIQPPFNFNIKNTGNWQECCWQEVNRRQVVIPKMGAWIANDLTIEGLEALRNERLRQSPRSDWDLIVQTPPSPPITIRARAAAD